MKIILASTSPRRKELLEKITKNFYIVSNHYNEENLKRSIHDPKKLCKALSYEKAQNVLDTHFRVSQEDCIILGCDTLLLFNGQIIGKPIDEKDAFLLLEKLQNHKHTVYTGTTFLVKKHKNLVIKQNISCATVFMKPMSQDEIKKYIATKEPLDKAGAYAIQGIGRNYVKKYEGDFDSIVGLDTSFVREVLTSYDLLS